MTSLKKVWLIMDEDTHLDKKGGGMSRRAFRQKREHM
jgi:hypothetical protein